MKTIMIPIVTLLLATLSIQANATQAKKEFTVTQIALDAAIENTTVLQEALVELEEDKNTSNEGGDTEEK